MEHEDYLEELIDERTTQNPDFPRLVDEAIARREQGRARTATGLEEAARELGVDPDELFGTSGSPRSGGPT